MFTLQQLFALLNDLDTIRNLTLDPDYNTLANRDKIEDVADRCHRKILDALQAQLAALKRTKIRNAKNSAGQTRATSAKINEPAEG